MDDDNFKKYVFAISLLHSAMLGAILGILVAMKC